MVLVVLVGLTALVGTVSALANGASERSNAAGSVSSVLPPGVDPSELPLAGGQGLDELFEGARKERERLDAMKARLESPAFRDARERSKAQHLGLADAAAEELVEREFSELLAGTKAGVGLAQLADGREVLRFADDHTVVLAGDETRPPVLLESPWPVRAIDDDGRKRQVDLNLEQDKDGFVPANAAVDVALPAELSAGVEVGPVRVVPEGSSEAELSGDGQDRLIYANAQMDTDVVMTPLVTGAEIFWQLRSARAAEELKLALDLPDGAVAELTKLGSAVISKNGKRMTTISPPSAVDAQGQDVPVAMEVRGTELVLSIAHRAADVAYPILVDPVIEDYWGPPSGGEAWHDQDPWAVARLGDWFTNYSGVGPGDYIRRLHCYPSVSCDAYWGEGYDFDTEDGLHIYVQPGLNYPGGSSGQWLYKAPGTTTRIVEAGLYSFYHRRGGSQNPFMYTGLWSNSVGWFAQRYEFQDINYQTIQHLANGTQPGLHYVVFGFATPNNVTNGWWRDGYIGAAVIALTDVENPTVIGGTLKRRERGTDGTFSWVDRNNLTEWVKPQDELAVRVNASDPGLGVRQVRVTGTGVDDMADSECAGNKADPCFDPWPADEWAFASVDVGGMSDGANNLTLQAWDALGHGSNSYTFPIKVDSVRPTIDDTTTDGDASDVTGSLWAGREQEGLPPESQSVLSPGSHPISFTAVEPGTSTTASGIKKVTIKVDGVVEQENTTGCSGPCSQSISWNYNTTSFLGRHKVSLCAIDKADGEYCRNFFVNAVATGDLVYPADGEITSSKIALQARDNDDDFTGVRFEYRRRIFGGWTTINSNLTDDQGTAVSGPTFALTEPGRHSKKLIWDVRTVLGALVPSETQIQVRAVFTAGGQEFKSRVSDVDLDVKGLSADNATESVGPGNVDLLTGNFNYSATDASLSSFGGPIALTRSFNSLDPDINPSGPLGPGWVSSAPLDGVSDYSSLVVLTDPSTKDWVDVFDSAGQRIRFEKTGETTFKAQPGFEALTLTRVVTSGQPDKYVLTDLDGVATTFVTLPTTSKFVPSKVEQPASQGTVSYDYEAYLKEPRLKRVIAPAPPGVDCIDPGKAATELPPGCRVLELVYENIPSFGAQRLTSIKHVASNGSAMVPDTVASFTYHADGRLAEAWDPRITPALKETYSYTPGNRLATITPPGEAPWTMSYTSAQGPDYLKINTVSRTADGSGEAAWRMRYQVPLSSPYNLAGTDQANADMAAWGQTDRPIDATAILPPTETGTGYSKATISYLNQDGRVVNIAGPGARISVAEYDPKGNVVRELSAANRWAAISAGGGTTTTATRAGLLSTYNTYSSDGLRLLETLGPEREVKLDSGDEVPARAHTVTTYDEGYTPQQGVPQPHLPTTVYAGAQVDPSEPDVDVRTVKTEYDWTLRKPTRTIVDAVSGGLNVASRVDYNTAGLETASWQPKSNGSDAGMAKTVYYGDSSDTDCSGHVEWFNWPCKTKPAAQPGTAGLPDLPVTAYTYDRYGNVLTETERVGSASRTTTTTYDAAGRTQTESVSTDSGSGGGGEDPEDPDGLVAAYGFNEGSGSTAGDSSENSLDGTISGATWTSAGKYGGALSFDGTDDSVSVADANALDLTTSMTLSAWVKMDAVSNRFQAILYKERNGNDGSYALEADSTVSSRPGLNFRTTGWQAARAPDPLSTATWAHLGATWDGTTAKIYLNGTLVKTQTMTGTVTTSTGLLKIGGTAITGSNQHVDALIDEVRIYNRALSQVEVQADKNTSVATQLEGAPPASTLVAAYGFDQGSGTTVADGSGYANDGTISGASWTSSGKYGSALSFDGTDDSVSIPDSDSLDLTSASTLSAWVKPDATYNRYQNIVTKERNGNDGSYVLAGDSTTNSRPGVEIRKSGGWEAARAPDPLAAGQWSHLAATWDGSTAKVYLNGTLVKTQSMTGTIVDSTGLLRIGGTAVFGNNRHVDGLIDEVRIYSRALSQTEVLADKDTPVADQIAALNPPSMGEAVPTVSYSYSNTTGRPTQVSTPGAITTTVYDNVGRETGYVDSTGLMTTTSYDKLDRPVTTNDGKGTQTNTYDANTGWLTSMSDSHAGTFTASYDSDGRIVSKTYPNGMKADTTYDPVGSPIALKYTKTSNCSSNCVWVDEQVTESIHGQWRTHSWELSSQEYTYDQAGRLTKVVDDVQSPAPVAGCTVRSYSFDANSNRTAMNTKAPAGNGDCQPGATGTTKNYSYDDADRLTGTGITYDKLGRMTAIPAQHAGGGALAYTYYADDQVRTISQDGISKTYALDPVGRQRQSVASGGTTHTETLRYSDDSDSPSWTSTANGQGQEISWERSVQGIDGDLAAIRTHDAQDDTTVLQVTNLHGDVIATASTDTQAAALTARFETDEFGNPRQSSGANKRYGWHGGDQRRTELASGVIQMGVRSYVPSLGRFTSVDPVVGGSANSYEYSAADPVNNMDLDGRACGPGKVGDKLVPDGRFKPACKRHDKCYGTHEGPSKKTCDNRFRKHMKRICSRDSDVVDLTACNAKAEGYYQSVHIGGGRAFRKAREKAREDAVVICAGKKKGCPGTLPEVARNVRKR